MWLVRRSGSEYMEQRQMDLGNELQERPETDDVFAVRRKTKRLASKLDRQDIVEWLRAELEGYPESMTPPDYRKIGVTGAYKTNGYIPAGYGYMKQGVEDLRSFPTGLSVRLPQ